MSFTTCTLWLNIFIQHFHGADAVTWIRDKVSKLWFILLTRAAKEKGIKFGTAYAGADPSRLLWDIHQVSRRAAWLSGSPL